jgi:hypothetical protein
VTKVPWKVSQLFVFLRVIDVLYDGRQQPLVKSDAGLGRYQNDDKPIQESVFGD